MATVVTWKDFTWTFTETATTGTFWDGMPWIYDSGAGLTLTAITPAAHGSNSSARNGTVINPQGSVLSQGFDGRMNNTGGTDNGYTEAANVGTSLPITVNAGDSIVSSWSASQGFNIARDHISFYVTSQTGTWNAGDTFTGGTLGSTATLQRAHRWTATGTGSYFLYLCTSSDGEFQIGETITNNNTGGTAVLYSAQLGSTLSYIGVMGCLTVVGSDLTGTEYFRPPYVGTSKPLYPTSQMNTSLLKGFTLPHDPRTDSNSSFRLNQTACAAQDVDMKPKYSLEYDFLGGTPNMNRQGIPHYWSIDYPGFNTGLGHAAKWNQIAALVHCGGTLSSGDYSAEKMAKYLVQTGIDHAPMVAEDSDNNNFNSGGGFPVGRLWPTIFAGLMLGVEEYKTVASGYCATKTAHNGDAWYKYSEQASFFNTNGGAVSAEYKSARPSHTYPRGKPLFGIQEDNPVRSSSNALTRIEGVYKYHAHESAGYGYSGWDATVTNYHPNDGSYMQTQIAPAFTGVYMAACWMGAQKYFYDNIPLASGEAPAFFDFMENFMEDTALPQQGVARNRWNSTPLVDQGTADNVVVNDGSNEDFTKDIFFRLTVKATNTQSSPNVDFKYNGVSKQFKNLSPSSIVGGTTYDVRYFAKYDGWFIETYVDLFTDPAPTSQDSGDLYQFGGMKDGIMRYLYNTHFKNKKKPIML